MERWLMDANNVLRESKDGHSVVIPPQTNLDPHTMSRKRKKRTSIDAKKRTTLDRRFIMNPKPSSEELQSIAEECDMEKEVVRVWFCNRRQKEKRISMHEQQQELSSPDSPEHISAPTTSYSVPWKFTEAECEPSTSTVLRRPTPQNSNIELNPSATVKSFPHNRIKQESQKMATLPAVFGHGVLSNPNQTPILLSAAAAKSKGIQQAVSLHDHKLGPSPSGPNHLFQLNKMDSMAFNNRVQPNHGQSQSKTNNTSLPLPTTTVLNSLLNIGSTSFAMNNSHHTMPSMVNSCTNSNFTLDSKPGAAS
uniref:Homeobox domain-containing protein n=1 Tax=Ciona savignyi TaxID=51511 RepID=H2Z3J0_CIOSA